VGAREGGACSRSSVGCTTRFRALRPGVPGSAAHPDLEARRQGWYGVCGAGLVALVGLELAPLTAVLLLFVAGAVILWAGTRLARTADQLADLTGMGEAGFGALLLGGGTSLPGLVASVTAAAEGYPALAVGNAVGGIAVQTAFLPLADLAYRGANIEHAAPSLQNLMNAGLLVVLLALVLTASLGPAPPLPDALDSVHPVTLVLYLAYVGGLRMSARAAERPLWRPEETAKTRLDRPDGETLARGHVHSAWLAFAALALVVALAGFVVGEAGIALVTRTDLSETVVGALFTGVITSLPELVTCVAAARQGAPTLAVANIIGGNGFDVLFVALADVAYRSGPIYKAVAAREQYLIAVTILLTGVLLLGMLRRERRGVANIGFEGLLVLSIYGGAMALLVLA